MSACGRYGPVEGAGAPGARGGPAGAWRRTQRPGRGPAAHTGGPVRTAPWAAGAGRAVRRPWARRVPRRRRPGRR
ncbi:hypothetical protein CP974_12745 [Streptomyces fradiae ATCC 10745 = DSM 40063]|nr:hypothetical protein CP974_12745 [Streptomyces fradiae ATCC 10745 = DSM 40063]